MDERLVKANARLIAMIQNLLESADDTGCTDDLTVVSKQALEKVEKAYLSVCMLTD